MKAWCGYYRPASAGIFLPERKDTLLIFRNDTGVWPGSKSARHGKVFRASNCDRRVEPTGSLQSSVGNARKNAGTTVWHLRCWVTQGVSAILYSASAGRVLGQGRSWQ